MKTQQKYLCLFILLMIMIALCTACKKEEPLKEEKQTGPDYYEADLVEASFFTRTENPEEVVIEIPFIASKTFDTIRVDETKWNFADSKLREVTVNLEEQYKGKYLYVIYLKVTIPTIGGQMTELPLIVDGKEISYRFGKAFSLEHDFAFCKGTEAKLQWYDITAVIPDNAVDMLDYNLSSYEIVQITDAFLSSKDLKFTEESLKKSREIVFVPKQKIRVFYDVEGTKNKYYLFETVIAYCAEEEDSEEEYILSLCMTRTNLLYTMKEYVDNLGEKK